MDQMMQLIPIRKKYVYPKLVRIDSEAGRTYTLDGQPAVPSVTTILSGTKDKSHLDAWAARVGQDEADRIKNDAATVGTHMHGVVERLLLNRPLETPRTWLAVKGYWMGYKLIETFMPHVNEVWGTEIPLYYPEKYAGTSDCIGVYKDHSAIIDFKQTNKMKQRKWIEDYFVQLAAYALAHDVSHGTKIEQGVIMMVAQDGETQEFVTCGREFDNYKDMWMRRVEAFQKNSPEA
jgi:genome maintenance exonuclease 1